MGVIKTILFILSIIFLLGGINFFLASKRGGVYPSRKVLQERALVLGGVGGVLFLLSILILWIF